MRPNQRLGIQTPSEVEQNFAKKILNLPAKSVPHPLTVSSGEPHRSGSVMPAIANSRKKSLNTRHPGNKFPQNGSAIRFTSNTIANTERGPVPKSGSSPEKKTALQTAVGEKEFGKLPEKQLLSSSPPPPHHWGRNNEGTSSAVPTPQWPSPDNDDNDIIRKRLFHKRSFHKSEIIPTAVILTRVSEFPISESVFSRLIA